MTETMLKFVGFPSIELLHNVVRLSETYPHLVPGPIEYRSKGKLHGTNAGITVAGGEYAAQSKSKVVTPQDDNAGFARWVEGFADYWKSLPDMTIFGEWCGPGIMRGTAINQIPSKVFAVFAIVAGGEFIADPAAIAAMLPDRPAGVHVLPWYGEAVVADFTDRPGLQALAARLNEVLAAVEPADPWVKEVFGVEGTAEGLVYYPLTGSPDSLKMFENFAFKVKGEKHQVVKTREAAQVDPEVAKTIEDFVVMFATEARFEQGLAAVGGSLEMKYVGAFLKWVATDVLKESEDELEVAGLEWDQVQKPVQTAARSWFIAKDKAL